jgi:hypothetical protein
LTAGTAVRLDGGMASKVKAISTAGTPARSFKTELTRRSNAFRQALATLLKQIGSPRSARALERELQASYTTCWRVVRLVHAEDCLAETQHAPSPGELKAFLVLAGKRGVPEMAIQAAMTAAEEFQAFVRRHAEDRESFNAMVSRPDERRRETLIVRERRAAYRALSRIWGLQTDLQVCTFMVGPTDPSESHPLTKLTLQRGVRRLRSDAQVILMGYDVRDINEHPPRPLDAAAADYYGMPLLPQFSSNNMPKVEPMTTEGGVRLYNMAGGEVGLRSSVEFAFGEHVADPCAGAPLWSISFTTKRKPLSLLVIDLLIHRASHPGVQPQSIMYQHQEADFTLATAMRSQRVPGGEQVELAGTADTVGLTEAPRYGKLLRYAADTRGWCLDDFDAYRLRIPFPVIGSTALIYYHVK